MELSVARDGLPKRFSKAIELQFHVHDPRVKCSAAGARGGHARQEGESRLGVS